MSAGKGDKPRPMDRKKFDDNYDRIFRNKKTVDENTHKKDLHQCTSQLKR